jgi:hypothetical protein
MKTMTMVQNATAPADWNSTSLSSMDNASLDNKIWFVFLFYAAVVWTVLFVIYRGARYVLAHYKILNVGSTASSYHPVSQEEHEHDYSHPTEGLQGKRLFPTDEDLELWDIEMTKTDSANAAISKQHRSEGNGGNFEYGLDSALDDENAVVDNLSDD